MAPKLWLLKVGSSKAEAFMLIDGRLPQDVVLSKLGLSSLTLQDDDQPGLFLDVPFRDGLSMTIFQPNKENEPLLVSGVEGSTLPTLVPMSTAGLRWFLPAEICAAALTPAAGTARSADQQVDQGSFKSYAISKADVYDAMEAYERLGWTFHPNLAADVDQELVKLIPTELPKVPWVEKEDDTTNKEAAAAALTEALCLYDFMVIVKIERTILVTYEGRLGNKRTKISGKTDFAVAYKKVTQQLLLNPSAWLAAMFLLLETKTTFAVKKLNEKSRASSAFECLAANLRLAEKYPLEKHCLPGGLPVLMTDVNNYCFGYIPYATEKKVEELWFATRFEGFAYFAEMLKSAREPTELLRRLRSGKKGQGPKDDGSNVNKEGNDGAQQGSNSQETQPGEMHNTSTSMQGAVSEQQSPETSAAELLEAEILDAGRHVCSQVNFDASGPEDVVEVYVETWEHALLRARFGDEVAAKNTHGQKYMRVPAAVAGLYVH